MNLKDPEPGSPEWWDTRASLLQILEHGVEWDTNSNPYRVGLVSWMCGLKTFAVSDPNAGSNVACALLNLEPTLENKTALGNACERLLERKETIR